MGLKPEIEQYLKQRATLGLPAVWQASLAEIREHTLFHVALSQPLIDIFEVSKTFFSGPTAELPVRIYRPNNSSQSPALVFYHGGGWVLNSLDIYESVLRKLAKESGLVIVAVEYQKAPEHPFPTPFNDCYATLVWVHENAEVLGINPNSIGVGGDSAGGNLASAVAIKVRDMNSFSLAFQLLIYPCNDNSMQYESAVKHGENLGLTTRAMEWFWAQYLQRESDKNDHYAVPSATKTLKGVAPALIYAAEFDPIVDDCRNYFAKLRSDFVPARYEEFPGQIHGFFNLGGISPDADLLYAHIARDMKCFLERAYG